MSADRSEDALHEEGLGTAEALARRLDRPWVCSACCSCSSYLGQVLAQQSWLITTFTVLGWVFWAVFVAEFLLRAYIAGFSRHFWRRNWWQVLFLAVPFLRFFRALAFFRVARVARVVRFGGVLSAGVRGSRSAGRLLTNRIAWLAVVTVVVILASSQLLYVTSGEITYGDALYQAAMATVTGAGLLGDGAFVRVLRFTLAVYSVGVFATLAGSMGAYFLRSGGEDSDAVEPQRPPVEKDD